jgi:hypothetical protein
MRSFQANIFWNASGAASVDRILLIVVIAGNIFISGCAILSRRPPDFSTSLLESKPETVFASFRNIYQAKYMDINDTANFEGYRHLPFANFDQSNVSILVNGDHILFAPFINNFGSIGLALGFQISSRASIIFLPSVDISTQYDDVDRYFWGLQANAKLFPIISVSYTYFKDNFSYDAFFTSNDTIIVRTYYIHSLGLNLKLDGKYLGGASLILRPHISYENSTRQWGYSADVTASVGLKDIIKRKFSGQ